MPHPVRDNQATTTPPHQPSPPHPTPQGTPLAAQRPPQQAPHPHAGCPAWAQLARRPASRAADARWVARRSPPARPPLALATCRPQRRVRAAGPGAFRCSRLLSVCRAPPPLATLRAADWGRVGCRWVGLAEQASGPPCSRSCGPRSTCAGPCWCLWATPAAAAFLRLFQLFVAALH